MYTLPELPEAGPLLINMGPLLPVVIAPVLNDKDPEHPAGWLPVEMYI
jgi:hypothetical protein